MDTKKMRTRELRVIKVPVIIHKKIAKHIEAVYDEEDRRVTKREVIIELLNEGLKNVTIHE